MTTGAIEWATQAGNVWTRRWRDTDAGLAQLGGELDAALLEAAPQGPFRALDIGCGAGTTSLHLAKARPDATILACDISPSLAGLARDRLAEFRNVRLAVGDVQEVASRERHFDLIFSRHGVMFFADPVAAFATLRAASAPGVKLVFSCFADWAMNAWAADVATAAASGPVPAPGREPGGFAFADPAYVLALLNASGWAQADARLVTFDYVAGRGPDAGHRALAFLSEIGPASRILDALPEAEQAIARDRMRQTIAHHQRGDAISFPAAAWIWTANVNA